MRIENQPLLVIFRSAARCELCGCRNRSGLDPHHVFTKGAGRLDIRINLVSLCRECHDKAPRMRNQMVAIVATREGLCNADIIVVIYWFRRLDRKAGLDRWKVALDQLNERQRGIAVQTFQESGLWEGRLDTNDSTTTRDRNARESSRSECSFPRFPAGDAGN